MKNFLTILFTTILLTGCVSVTKEFRTTAEFCAMGGYSKFAPDVHTNSMGTRVNCTGFGNSVNCGSHNNVLMLDTNKKIRDVYILRCTKQTCLEKYNNEDCITGDPIKDEKVIIRGIKWLEIIPAAL